MVVFATDKNGDEVATVSASELQIMFKEIRKQAIEEFAEVLKKELNKYDFWKYDIITDLGVMETNVSRDYIIDEIATELKRN